MRRSASDNRVQPDTNPPEFRGQRRGYRALKFAADCLELPLQPGHALWRQGSRGRRSLAGLHYRRCCWPGSWGMAFAGTIRFQGGGEGPVPGGGRTL